MFPIRKSREGWLKPESHRSILIKEAQRGREDVVISTVCKTKKVTKWRGTRVLSEKGRNTGREKAKRGKTSVKRKEKKV